MSDVARICATLNEDGIAIVPARDLWDQYDQWRDPAIADGEAFLARCEADASYCQSPRKPFLRLSSLDQRPQALVPLRGPLIALAAQWLHTRDIRPYAMAYWVMFPSLGAKVYSQVWHRDADADHPLKVFLHLREVTARNGPFEYVRGSSGDRCLNWCALKSYAKPDRDIPTEQIVTCTVPADTVVLADTSGIHRGGNLESGVRLQAVWAFRESANRRLFPHV